MSPEHTPPSATDLESLRDYAAELGCMRTQDLSATRPTLRAVFAVAAAEYARALSGASWAPNVRAEAQRLASEFRWLVEAAVALQP
jgi:hypothetical protein